MENEIIIVSGLPRSGTSLMMQMLDNGGIEVVTDNVRTADTDNPRGYYEFEQVKKIKEDVSWLPGTRGKAFKMVSQLLYELPASEKYRVIFMERDLDEMIRSQEKMLARLGKPRPPATRSSGTSPGTSKSCERGSAEQRNFEVCSTSVTTSSYESPRSRPRVSARSLQAADAASMAKTVDPSLYRNRTASIDRSSGRS